VGWGPGLRYLNYRGYGVGFFSRTCNFVKCTCMHYRLNCWPGCLCFIELPFELFILQNNVLWSTVTAMWSFCLRTNTCCMIRTCKSHISMHKSTGMGTGWGWRKFRGDGAGMGVGADFHCRVTLYKGDNSSKFWLLGLRQGVFTVFSVVLLTSHSILTCPCSSNSGMALLRSC